MNNYPQQIDDIIKLSNDMITKADQINNRLVNAIVIIAVAFSISFAVTVVGIANLYFTSDYTYPLVNQNQFNTENSNQSINKGVK